MRAIWLATGVVAAAILAGCASDPPAEQQTTTSNTSNAPAGHGSLAQCLNDHGVPAAPGPAAAPPPGVDPDTWHRAMQACASFAPGPAG
ncbi:MULTISPECIES: hypothetical protein [unclassified Mycobacterium]|uniref:hypothetical protein n=1 Tax=unclassified Mycobacterium TaxID=2642494 RepID=UPI00073FFCBF|nr:MULTISPECIES: hypothetical protein [unclassified Mycobacterium]KUH80793.1 hypothetical protein AU185_22810 [Mycobacterium sp. GA-0227b]KUH92411.1 hypothetical protein AU186_08400 [Mycobacterium sp. GA-1999]